MAQNDKNKMAKKWQKATQNRMAKTKCYKMKKKCQKQNGQNGKKKQLNKKSNQKENKIFKN